MNKKQFNKKLKILNDKHKLAKEALALKCAMSNSPVKLGDIIVGVTNRVSVESIRAHWLSMDQIPTCYYSGPKLTDNNVPYKNGKYVRIHQSNVAKINGVAHKPM